MTGYDRDEVIGKRVFEVGLWADEHLQPLLAAAIDSAGALGQLESRFRTKSGELRVAEFSLQLVPIGDEHYILVVGRDITDRRRAEEEAHQTIGWLRKIERERRQLLGRLRAAQEEERERIAQDIHDDALQLLGSGILHLNLLRAEDVEPHCRTWLAKAKEEVKAATARLRNLTFELVPPDLEMLGLARALEHYIREFTRQTEIHVELENRLKERPAAEVASALYRIVLEAMANVRKHALASSVKVLLAGRDAGILLRIEDDGVGFALAGPKGSHDRPGHLGLRSMRDRAEGLGGEFHIRSAPGAGVSIEVRVPDPFTPSPVSGHRRTAP